jgi:hypothetical protein
VLPSGQKLTSGLLATITLEVVPLRASSISKFILEVVVFCEGVQCRLPFCLDHLNPAKMAASQFYLQSGKGRKVW